ncbi:hypothetical protein OGATHE_002226 [Ogataea polymorpha]|uniref:Uncharacterized protein n=1 Tax=Ogataea polymorpha TaxID=460523 RepID=A0A9P8PID5_9ASCO|nr:hypothetical protein OGATHE_002226 [Ogataea polymorpha]
MKLLYKSLIGSTLPFSFVTATCLAKSLTRSSSRIVRRSSSCKLATASRSPMVTERNVISCLRSGGHTQLQNPLARDRNWILFARSISNLEMDRSKRTLAAWK